MLDYKFVKPKEMKNIAYTLLIITLFFFSCNKVLDVMPTAYVSSDIALNDSVGIERAIVGAYSGLQAIGLYSRNAAIVGDIAADNLVWTGTTQEYGQIMNKTILADNAVSEGMWAASYSVINQVNNILYSIPDLSYKSPNGGNKSEGEALFLRALMYHYLVSFYGNVPLRLLPTIDLSTIDFEPSTKTEVFEWIINDLETAVSLLPVTNSVGRATRISAQALLARVSLAQFHANGNTDLASKAIQIASELISASSGLETRFADLFEPDINSTESLMEIAYDIQNFNRLAQYYYSRDLNGRYEIAPSADLINSYDMNDSRFAVTIRYDEKNNPYGGKYNDVAGGVDKVYVLRLAEMYLIRAEALAYTNGNIADIQADINKIRNRADLANTSASTHDELKLVIEKERRHEFAFEGHRWYDLVRTDRAKEVLNISQNQTLFPIPLSEMQTNKKMVQNPGY